MIKIRYGLAIIAICGLSLLVLFQSLLTVIPAAPFSPAHEIRYKEQMVNADVQLTDEICRSECAITFQKTLKQLNLTDDGDLITTLDKIQSDHPHMLQMTMIRYTNGHENNRTAGRLSATITRNTASAMQQAKSHVQAGKSYLSKPIMIDGIHYLVLGVPAVDRHSAIVGVIRQTILKEVSAHQMKNLHLSANPGANSKTQSVNTKSLQKVTILHPEDHQDASHYHKNQVVVKFKQPLTKEQLAKIQRDIQATVIKKSGNVYVFAADKRDTMQLTAYFQKWHVVYVEPHYIYIANRESNAAAPAPNDTLYAQYQWNLPIIETSFGWELGKGSKDVIIAVVDTGVDMNHPDLQGRLLPGYNMIHAGLPPDDDVGHGTHVAGVISAQVNNGEGVAGMTWFNPIMPVKVLDDSGEGNTYNVSEGIIWAVDHGAKVINLSLGNNADANFLHNAIQYAFNKDAVMIAAAGNDNTNEPSYPAAYPEVFAVAATDAAKNRAPFSNYGNYISAAAPGVNIASTYPHNQYASLSGTSMASPHVAALAALIRSINPLLKNTEVMAIMRQTAEDLGAPGRDVFYGYGQIDVVKALQQAQGSMSSLAYWPQRLSREMEQMSVNVKESLP